MSDYVVQNVALNFKFLVALLINKQFFHITNIFIF